MDSGEKPNVAQKEPLALGDVARRVGGALANLVPNSRPISRERPEEHEEPQFSLDPGVGEDAAAEAEVIHSLDAQRKKRGGGAKRNPASPHKPLTIKQARNLDALRKKKSA